VVKKPKGLSSDLSMTGQWAVVVRRIINGTGVLKVYLIQTKKYAYHLKFVRAITAEWVLEALKNISADVNIRYEDENVTEENKVQEKIADVESQGSKQIDQMDLESMDEEEEVQIIGGNKKEIVGMRSINLLKMHGMEATLNWNQVKKRSSLKL
jgi:hypothetical protein